MENKNIIIIAIAILLLIIYKIKLQNEQSDEEILKESVTTSNVTIQEIVDDDIYDNEQLESYKEEPDNDYNPDEELRKKGIRGKPATNYTGKSSRRESSENEIIDDLTNINIYKRITK